MFASIPSPSDGVLHIGPLGIHAYGLMIALGVLAAVWLAGRRLEQAGTGTREDMSAIAVWAVIAGVIGSRLYFIITDASKPWKRPSEWIKIWQGGLGIPGGMLAGVLVGVWMAKRRGVGVSAVITAAAPALPLAQAIGRWGNYWNQELFGRPTTLPWALRVSESKTLAAGYPVGTTFHPTFLYESVWNLALCGLLLLIDRQRHPPRGRLLAMYVVGYGIGRFWIEGLRIDPANHGGGLRLNQWVAIAAVVGGAAFLIIDSLRHRGPESEPAADDEYVAADEPADT